MLAGPAVHAVAEAEPLDEVLAGRLGADAVRRVVLRPLEHGLAPLLHDCLPHGRTWYLRLVRSKYKPPHKLTAFYTATTCSATHQGPPPDERHLAVSWHSAESPTGPGSRGHGSCGPVTTLVYPADPSMPALARLSDRAYLASLVVSLAGPAGGVSPPLRVGVLRYRPGQRHVLRATDLAGRTALFVKTDAEDTSSRAVRIARVLGPELENRTAWAGVVQPLGHCADDRASLWWESAGRPLWRVCTSVGPANSLMHGLGEAVRVLHDTCLRCGGTADDPAAHPRCRDAAEHAALTLRAGEHISALLPQVGRRYHDLACRLVERLDQLPEGPPGLVHGDLKCDHVLVDDGRFRLIDLDRAGYGDPALDLGALLADLRWWYPDRRAEVLSSALRTGYGRSETARWARAYTLAALFQLRSAAHRCAVHEPAWESRVRARVAAAALTALRAQRWS